MNKDFEIYRASEDQIPTEDKARLEGYLEGRAQAVELERQRERITKDLNDYIKNKKK